MSAGRTEPPREGALIEAARGGDQEAYRRLVEDRQGELHAHCYRMLGSVHDADDALQDALLRAWRGLPRFDGRSSLRTWLYRIATNTSLDVIARRPSRVLPIDRGPATDPHEPLAEPVTESVWIEAYPDAALGEGPVTPESRYEQRESVELAFVAALQHLPANQRAALVLREVLGFSAQEAAETLETSVPALNSALQRARRAIEERRPEQSQQTALRALGDQGARRLVAAYSDAMERGDVDAVIGMLTEDATWSMPPLPCWFAGHDGVAGFLSRYAFSVAWRHLPARASGQVAVGCYARDPVSGRYVASVLDVLSVAGGRISAVTAFATADVFRRLARPEGPYVVSELFARIGLPPELPAR
jgi:RNA polymerase sigma-70 factor (ECF subfamily)